MKRSAVATSFKGGKADMPKLVTALRRLDLVRVTPSAVKRAA